MTSRLTRVVSRYSTAAAVEESIIPPLKVKYTQLFINGQFVDSASGKKFETCNPRTGNVIADAEDINRAVKAAGSLAKLLMRVPGE